MKEQNGKKLIKVFNPNEIKLIIWDLDDTLWKGTIEESNIEIVVENISFIEKLNNYGILNSICSKNNYIKVEKN